tara:strand:+ start:1128 stop:1292 length:165 start_codon:yes stop_codon:yes gene_type:complete
MRHYLILIFITFYIVGCGTTGPLSLPEGVKDRKNYNYPPEIDTTCFPSVSKCED